jgi:hypothetical protein
MSKQPQTTPGLPAKSLKVTSSELPPAHTPHHDEWLLDEALVDAFSGTDPIAVAPNTPTSDEGV